MPYSKKKSANRAKYKFLKGVHSLTHDDKDAVLPYLNEAGSEAIYECVQNVIKNSAVSNRKDLRTKLIPHKKNLKYLINPKISHAKKKVRSKKVGGAIFTTILAAALPMLLSSLFGK